MDLSEMFGNSIFEFIEFESEMVLIVLELSVSFSLFVPNEPFPSPSKFLLEILFME